MACVLLIVAMGVIGTITSALLWSVRQIQPVGQIRSKVETLDIEVEALTAQVAKLRTRKAAAASPRTKPKPDDPRLAGLDPRQAALFKDWAWGVEGLEEEEVSN